MKDHTDCAIRKMFLRRKLRSIEARRNKCSIINRLRYPKTDSGRRRYIQHSLNESSNCTPAWIELIICLILLPILIPVILYAGGVWIYRRIRREP